MQTVQIGPESIVDSYGVRNITPEDFLYFRSVFSNLAEPISDYTFANNYMFVKSFKMFWKSIHNHLCLFILEEGCLHMFLPPCPEVGATLMDTREALIESFGILNDYNAHQGKYFIGTIQYVSDELLERINRSGVEGFFSVSSPMGKDYIYDMERMISLSGSGLDSKRHARNKFIRSYPEYTTREITASDIPACLELLNIWYENKSSRDAEFSLQQYDYYVDPERIACEMVIKESGSMGLKGMVLYVRDTLVGFTYGEPLTSTQASILIEKTHPDYYGASALIFSEFCKKFWSGYAECNVGDHANSPNLRFTKQQYRPIGFLNKSVIMQTCPTGFKTPNSIYQESINER